MIPFILAQSDLAAAAGPDLVPPLWRMAAGLMVVLALLSVLAWVMRRTLAGRRATGAMTVETALSLGERRSLVVVSVEGRRLLVGLAPGQVALLTELGARSFDQALAQAATTEAQP